MPPWETCGALPLISTLRSPFWVLRLRLPWRAEEQRVFRTEKRKRAEAGGCLVTRLQTQEGRTTSKVSGSAAPEPAQPSSCWGCHAVWLSLYMMAQPGKTPA